MQDPSVPGVPPLKFRPGRVSGRLLGGEELAVAGGRPSLKLLVDPMRVLRGSGRRDLELVRTAMAVALIEGFSVDLGSGQLIKTVE